MKRAGNDYRRALTVSSPGRRRIVQRQGLAWICRLDAHLIALVGVVAEKMPIVAIAFDGPTLH